uniref:Crystaline entomocidal protoxin n=1 Tax=Bacillus thuringiensis TaxID=1428 RepID=A0A7R6AZ69_BACTU|nr:Cry9A protein [Bacillus thuringiensis]
MNPYQNKNEYEILDSSQNNFNMSINHLQYPLKNSPYPQFSIDNCRRSNTATWVNNIGDAVSESISLVSTILGIFTEPNLWGVFSALIGLLDRMRGALGTPSIAALSICDLLEIIDERVNRSVLNDGIADFNGSLALFGNFLSALNSWRNNPNNSTADELRFRFRASDSEFDRSLTNGSLTHGGSLARQDAQILLLPSFAKAAYFHLFLLNEAITSGSNWGLEIRPTINYQEKLENSIRNYTNYCVHWYNQGLEEIRRRNNSGENWLVFHRFRRDMTLQVLDLVATFPNFDTNRYSTSMPITTQLSRVIYTDPIGCVSQSHLNSNWFGPVNGTNFTSLENEIPSPTLSQFLNSIDLVDQPLRWGVGTNGGNTWQGNTNSFNFSSSSTVFHESYGRRTGQNIIRGLNGRDVFRIDSRPISLDGHTFGVNRVEFHHTTSSQNSIYTGYLRTSGLNRPVVQNVRTFLPGENSDIPNREDYTHRLSRVANITGGLRHVAVREDQSSSLLLYGWTHKSLTRENMYNLNEIFQIPAVKTMNTPGIQVIAGPGSTGGDLLRLNLGARVTYNCRPARPLETPMVVHVRVRYASVGSSTIRIEFTDPSGSFNPQTLALPDTNSSLNNLQYQNFNMVTTNFARGTSIMQGNFSISIINMNGANLALDKIEIIPVRIGRNTSEQVKEFIDKLGCVAKFEKYSYSLSGSE